MQVRPTTQFVITSVVLVMVILAGSWMGLATSRRAVQQVSVDQQVDAGTQSSASAPNDDPQPVRGDHVAAVSVGATKLQEHTTTSGARSASAHRSDRASVGEVRSTYEVVRVARSLPIRTGRGTGRVVGMMPATSAYLGAPMFAWIEERSADGRWGYVHVPWSVRPRGGWISLAGRGVRRTHVAVVASLSERRVRVFRNGRKVVDAPAAIGAASSPSPTGAFFVTDRVPISPPSAAYGSFAFGISALQPHTPPGWTGGNQMAIHGTGDPASIGRAVSAGCLRVSESTLAQLRGMLAPGTPVVITA